MHPTQKQTLVPPPSYDGNVGDDDDDDDGDDDDDDHNHALGKQCVMR